MQGIVWARPARSADLRSGSGPSDEPWDELDSTPGPPPPRMGKHHSAAGLAPGNHPSARLPPLRTHIIVQPQKQQQWLPDQQLPLKQLPQHHIPQGLWKQQVEVWAEAQRHVDGQQKHSRDSGASPDTDMSDATPLTAYSSHPEIEECPTSPQGPQCQYMGDTRPHHPHALHSTSVAAAAAAPLTDSLARGRSGSMELGHNGGWERSPSPPARPPPSPGFEPPSEELRQQLLQQLAEMERERRLFGQQRMARAKREQEERLYQRYLQVQETLKRRSPTTSLALAGCTRIGRLYQRPSADRSPIWQPGQQHVKLLNAAERQEKLEQLVELEQQRVARWRPVRRPAVCALHVVAAPCDALSAVGSKGFTKEAGYSTGDVTPPPNESITTATRLLPHTPPVSTPDWREPSAQTGSQQIGGALVSPAGGAAGAAAVRAVAAATVAALAPTPSNVTSETDNSTRPLLLPHQRGSHYYQQHPELLSSQRAKALLEQRQEQLQQQHAAAEQREREREQERLRRLQAHAGAASMDSQWGQGDYDVPDLGEEVSEDAAVEISSDAAAAAVAADACFELPQHIQQQPCRRGPSGSSASGVGSLCAMPGVVVPDSSSMHTAGYSASIHSHASMSPASPHACQRSSFSPYSSATGPAISSSCVMAVNSIVLGPQGPMLVAPDSVLRSYDSHQPSMHLSPLPAATQRTRQLPPPPPSLQPQVSSRMMQSEATHVAVVASGAPSGCLSTGSGSYISCATPSPEAVNPRSAGKKPAPPLPGAPPVTRTSSIGGSSVAQTPSYGARGEPEQCTICTAAPSEVVFLHPSAVHRCVCRDCAQGIKIGNPCPVCMEPILGVLRVYSAADADAPKPTLRH